MVTLIPGGVVVIILLIFGLCIIGSFYVLNNCCCYEDPALQQARYEKLKAQRRAREAAEGLAAQATRPPDPSCRTHRAGSPARTVSGRIIARCTELRQPHCSPQL